MDGQLRQADGRWQLTFLRTFAHPREAVWRALTEPGPLEAWFPAAVEGDREQGAKLQFVFRHDEGPPADGEMLGYDEPAALEYRWGDDVLRFELEPDGDDTALTFVVTFDELGRASRDAAGWHTCLDELGCHLDGAQPLWSSAERWNEVHPQYVERFGPEASAIGPPAGR